MEGIPLAFVTERFPMLELFVTGNLECMFKSTLPWKQNAKTIVETIKMNSSRGNSKNMTNMKSFTVSIDSDL